MDSSQKSTVRHFCIESFPEGSWVLEFQFSWPRNVTPGPCVTLSGRAYAHISSTSHTDSYCVHNHRLASFLFFDSGIITGNAEVSSRLKPSFGWQLLSQMCGTHGCNPDVARQVQEGDLRLWGSRG